MRATSLLSPRSFTIRIANVAPIGRDSTRPARCARFDSRRRRWPRGISRTAIARGSAQDWAAQCATGRAADMPTRRTAATAAAARRNRSSSLGKRRSRIRTRPPAFHRHSIGAPSTSAQTTNAQRRTRAIATPRAARRECARDRTPASREPSSRLAAQCLQSLDHAEQRAAVLFGAVPRLDDRLAQQIVVRRRQPGRLPRLDAIETA